MNNQEQRSELRRFLKDRRARVDPVDVGITATGRRRVRGLRREEVAELAGIGVSWYTALESGEAEGVSEATVLALATALRLSNSERNYLLTLAGRLAVPDQLDTPSELLKETMRALTFPAYIVTTSWDVLDCNDAFRRVWGINENEVPFDAIERLFMAEKARKLHAGHFITNIAPVVAMLRSAVGLRPHLTSLQSLREKLVAEKDANERDRIATEAAATKKPSLGSRSVSVSRPSGRSWHPPLHVRANPESQLYRQQTRGRFGRYCASLEPASSG